METLNTIFNEVEKIAYDFNIKEADSIILTFKKDFGILKFKNAADQNTTAADPYNPLPSSQAAPAIQSDPSENVANLPVQNAAPEEKSDTLSQKPEEEKKPEQTKEQPKNIMDDPEVQNAMSSVESKFGTLASEVDTIIQQGKEEFKEGDPSQLPQFLENKLKEAGILDKIQQASQDPDMQKLINLSGADGGKPKITAETENINQPSSEQIPPQTPA